MKRTSNFQILLIFYNFLFIFFGIFGFYPLLANTADPVAISIVLSETTSDKYPQYSESINSINTSSHKSHNHNSKPGTRNSELRTRNSELNPEPRTRNPELNSEPGTQNPELNPEPGTRNSELNPEPGTRNSELNPEPGTRNPELNPEPGTRNSELNHEPGTRNSQLNPKLGTRNSELNPKPGTRNSELYPDLEDLLEGFEDEADTQEVIKETVEEREDDAPPSRVTLEGFFKQGVSYNFAHDKPEEGETDWRRFSRLRAEAELELNARLSDDWQMRIIGHAAYDPIFALRGRSDYTDEVLDEYETDLELRDTWLLGTLFPSLDIKLGRQIVVWGRSDNIRITDVLNPLDLREPGLTDIEDLRLPVTMARVDYYHGPWNLTGMAIPEIRFNKGPEFGSDFFPSTTPPPPEDEPSDFSDATEYAAALNGVFSGWDVSLYWARYFNDLSRIDLKRASLIPGSSPLFPPTVEVDTERVHDRLTMIGGAMNLTRGNWLLKIEAAWFDGIEFFQAPVMGPGGLRIPADETYQEVDVLAGIEYAGFSEASVSLDVANRHIRHFDKALEEPPNEAKQDRFQTALRATKDYLNDTLTITVLISLYNALGQDGAAERFTVEYDITDAVELTGGVVFYQSGDLPEFETIGDNDRVYAEIKYSF